MTHGGAEYGYTAWGSLTNRCAGQEETVYHYDALGNLLGVDLPSGRSVSYEVDPLGRRIGKRVDGELVRRWVYRDGLNPVAEYDGEGRLVSVFVYGTRRNVPEYMVRSGETYRIVSDELGSVRLVVDTRDGSVVQRMEYDEFGRVMQDTNPGFQPFGFGGGLYDPDTGLVRFGLRDYDAETGRWTAKDPLLFGGGEVNLYLYCHGDPVNYLDPWGLGEGQNTFLGWPLYTPVRSGDWVWEALRSDPDWVNSITAPAPPSWAELSDLFGAMWSFNVLLVESVPPGISWGNPHLDVIWRVWTILTALFEHMREEEHDIDEEMVQRWLRGESAR